MGRDKVKATKKKCWLSFFYRWWFQTALWILASNCAKKLGIEIRPIGGQQIHRATICFLWPKNKAFGKFSSFAMLVLRVRRDLITRFLSNVFPIISPRRYDFPLHSLSALNLLGREMVASQSSTTVVLAGHYRQTGSCRIQLSSLFLAFRYILYIWLVNRLSSDEWDEKKYASSILVTEKTSSTINWRRMMLIANGLKTLPVLFVTFQNVCWNNCTFYV